MSVLCLVWEETSDSKKHVYIHFIRTVERHSGKCMKLLTPGKKLKQTAVHLKERNREIKHFWTSKFYVFTLQQYRISSAALVSYSKIHNGIFVTFNRQELKLLFEGSGHVVTSLCNLQLWCVTAHLQTLTPENKTQSTPLFAWYDRLQQGGISPACFAYDCRGSGSKRGSYELMKCSLLLSGGLAEVLLYGTLRIYTSDAPLTPCFRGDPR